MENEMGKVIPVDIEREMRKSFLEYSMSVIVSRALPDVRDGLKPVHRRILYTMNEAGLTPDAVLTDVEEALAALGELIGKTVREDLVDTIFSRFCVGK